VAGFLVLGCVFLLLALLLSFITALTLDLRRLRRMLATPPCRVAELPAAGVVRLRGKLQPSEEGPLESPFGHEPALWAKVVVGPLRSGKGGRYLVPELELELCRAAELEDEAGDRVRVELEGAHVIRSTLEVPARHKASAKAVAALLEATGKPHADHANLEGKLHAEELRLAPGAQVMVLGQVSRLEADADGVYRASKGAGVLRARAGKSGELVVTSHDEASIQALVRSQKLTRIVFVIIGLLLMVLGWAVGD
jgi:hypothetical protein